MSTPVHSSLAQSRISRRSLVASSASAAALLALTGAQAARPVAAQGTPLKVVATFSVLEDWLKNIGGDAIELSTIVPAGGDAHGFDPSPEQVASLADANLIFEIGLGFETWLDDMVAASGTSATRVVVSEGITVRTLTEGEDHDHEGDDESHDHGDTDPHIWGNVRNAITACGTITTALGQGDLDLRATFQRAHDAYVGQLGALDGWVKAQVGAVPAEERRIVTSHDALGYYTDAYGIEIVGTILGLSTEEAEPSARQIAELVDQIKAANVKAIFPENVENPQLLESVASEAGVKVGATLYTDALGEPGSNGDTYIRMITWNTTALVAGMQGEDAPTTVDATPDLDASPEASPA
ncbi:MAG: metal ABC transporter solute-binding protein, Zn/Mn family [Thermomicrobiales bacterium]